MIRMLCAWKLPSICKNPNDYHKNMQFDIVDNKAIIMYQTESVRCSCCIPELLKRVFSCLVLHHVEVGSKVSAGIKAPPCGPQGLTYVTAIRERMLYESPSACKSYTSVCGMYASFAAFRTPKRISASSARISIVEMAGILWW